MTLRQSNLPLMLAGWLLAWSHAAASSTDQEIESIDFQRDIRPILSENCFQCHGPDENTREADLRLDQAAGAIADLGGYAAIVPGDTDGSELIRRVTSKDPVERMPPAESGKSLTQRQIELLRRWIETGAEYQQHWAFVPPERPLLPQVNDTTWPHNGIDHFVRSRLERENLAPTPPADRYQLVRRVYLDLIGLPPTIAQADAFASDQRPDAYERLVDQLLDSPHYGERWARRWLDLARYSDTKGYEKDQPRTMWHYRDWVINALNNDMPFDEFTIEQLAGDMLPNATLQQRIATGFHRNTMTNEEGGIDPQEFRFHSVIDRVATTGTTWLGLTIGCAQCHTHKFDPITHTEFYGLFAFLNNADEPKIDVPNSDVEELQQERAEQIESLISQLPDQFPVDPVSANEQSADSNPAGIGPKQAFEKAFQSWKSQQRERLVPWQILSPLQVTSNLPTTQVLEDRSVLCGGDVTKNDTFEVLFAGTSQPITAIRLEALPHSSLPGGGPGRQTIVGAKDREGNFFLSEVDAWIVNENGDDEIPQQLSWKTASASYVVAGLSAENPIDGKHDTGWTIHGREGERHTLVLVPSSPITLAPHQRLKLRLQHENFYPAGLGRFRISATSADGPIEATGLPADVGTALKSSQSEFTDEQNTLLHRYFALTTPSLKKQQDEVTNLQKNIPRLTTALVMQERAPEFARLTHLHHRGEYLQPQQEVLPGVLEVLHDLPADSKKDRLAFARWLVSRENPLVARVVMNRHWEALFGRGIVETPEDFGYQGAYPTHPQLLDWLAVEFMERGWSLKQMHKLMVLSATYQQSSKANPDSLERDPENKRLSRGPRFRVDSELVRDILLTASGLLNPQVSGPSVFPPQPAGITESAYGPLAWETSRGADRYRRGLYTFNKRTAPYAVFNLFDAPSGEVCLPRRDRSNTPLQSLALLNDVVVLEAARYMAGEALQQHGQGSQRALATELFRRCVTRLPKEIEINRLIDFANAQLTRIQSEQASAYELLNSGPTREWTFETDNSEWHALHHCQVESKDGKLRVVSTGNDSQIRAAVSAPSGKFVLTMKARCATQGSCEVFWTTATDDQASPDRSDGVEIKPNQWHDYRFTLQAADPLSGLRLDLGQSKVIVEIEDIRLFYGDGLYEIPPHVDPDHLAAWMLTARAILNLDETITKP